MHAMPIDSVVAVFVYGTLKSGQCRHHCWPAEPLTVEKAWTLGELYDTGPFPALFPGEDRVAGELWNFPSDAIARVLNALDVIEEYRPGHEVTNLYNRQVVECTDQFARVHRAYTYIYARADQKREFKRVPPNHSWNGRSYAVWPASADW